MDDLNNIAKWYCEHEITATEDYEVLRIKKERDNNEN